MREIRLTNGLIALVDNDNFEELNKLKWSAIKSRIGFYAKANIIGELMHRYILNLDSNKSKSIHLDGNGLNNQKDNLILISASSIHPGVSLHTQNKTWRARILSGGKMINLGYFYDEIKAAEAYNIAANVEPL